MIVNRADAALMPIGSTRAAGHRRLTYPVLTHWVVGACLATEGRADSHRVGKHRAVAQLARVPVSKTGGWGFESLLPCEYGPAKPLPANVLGEDMATQTRGEAREKRSGSG